MSVDGCDDSTTINHKSVGIFQKVFTSLKPLVEYKKLLCWHTLIHLLGVTVLVHLLKMALDNQLPLLSTPQKYIPMENKCSISNMSLELDYNMVDATKLKTNKLGPPNDTIATVTDNSTFNFIYSYNYLYYRYVWIFNF